MADAKFDRRTFLKGAAMAAAAAFCGAFAGCADGEAVSSASEEPEAPLSDTTLADGRVPGDAAEGSGKVLVAYFSATGSTRGVAETIAAHIGADIFEIAPAQPYTDADLDYGDSASRTSIERSDPDRAVELVQVTPEGFDAYDTVYLGYPIWWGDASWAVDGFVSGNDFSGKAVVPFCTSGSSPIGQSGQNLAALAGSGEWLEGRRFPAGAAVDEVAAWVDGLDI